MIKTTLTWYDFYKDKVNESYYEYIISRYNIFIKEIRKEINYDSRILEVGAGMGNITKALQNLIPVCKYHITDKNTDMLKLAYKNLSILCNYNVHDVLTPYTNNWEIIHSHGLLEHFSNDEIRLIILNQLKVGKNLIHYVPSNKYTYKSFGDERLMSPKEWFKICQPDEIIEFNDGYDLILKWRNY